jgi:hypothetical protein
VTTTRRAAGTGRLLLSTGSKCSIHGPSPIGSIQAPISIISLLNESLPRRNYRATVSTGQRTIRRLRQTQNCRGRGPRRPRRSGPVAPPTCTATPTLRGHAKEVLAAYDVVVFRPCHGSAAVTVAHGGGPKSHLECYCLGSCASTTRATHDSPPGRVLNRSGEGPRTLSALTTKKYLRY